MGKTKQQLEPSKNIFLDCIFPFLNIVFYRKESARLKNKKILRRSVISLSALIFFVLVLAIPSANSSNINGRISYSTLDGEPIRVKTITNFDDLPKEEIKSDSDKSTEQTDAAKSDNQSQTNVQTNNLSATSSNNSASNDVMAGIKIAEAENVSYTRKDYEPSWDVGGGCNIRARILQATSLVIFQTSNGCTVTYGSWYDQYTGKTMTGNPYRGDDGTSNDLDIDHIIPLKYVNSHGGYYWSSLQKRAYGASLAGMNNGVYLAVSASENRRKSDNGPASYYPPNPSFRCEYARRWRSLARLYSIALSSADYNTVKTVLVSCGDK